MDVACTPNEKPMKNFEKIFCFPVIISQFLMAKNLVVNLGFTRFELPSTSFFYFFFFLNWQKFTIPINIVIDFKASIPVEPKTGSPFYAEPADAIKQAAAFRRRIKPAGSNSSQALARNRHSDPTLLHQWPPSIADGGMLERIDSKEELITTNGSFSTSVDNLVTFPNIRRKSGGNPAAVKNIKPIDPPKVAPAKGKGGNEIWAVDSSWEFFSE